MCASFDHASSLGFNLSDEQRQRFLADGAVAQWAAHGSARQFEHRRGAPRQSLVDLARSAAALCDQAVRRYWLDAVTAMQRDLVGAVLAAAPAMSEVARDFTQEMIMIN